MRSCRAISKWKGGGPPEDGAYLEKKIYKKEEEWVFETFNLSVKGTGLLI